MTSHLMSYEFFFRKKPTILLSSSQRPLGGGVVEKNNQVRQRFGSQRVLLFSDSSSVNCLDISKL